MSRMTLRIAPRDDGEVLMQMEDGDTPLAHMIFDGASVEEVIRNLSAARMQLPEAVTPDLDPGARMEAVVDPRWKTELISDHGVAVLALRHPGLGWVSFAFPPHEALALGQSLQKIGEQLGAKGETPPS